MPQDGVNEANDSTGVRELIAGGAEIAGAALGGALSFIAVGPSGAAAGAAMGVATARLLSNIGEEASKRLLAPREKVRLGGVLAIAANEIQERIERGESVRSDGFFGKEGQGRSDAEEVVESILLKSQREPEEKKLPYMGHLLANVAFDARVSPEMAHQITKIADALTYRQICILCLAVKKEAFGLRQENYREQSQFSVELYQILHDCFELDRRALLNSGHMLFGLTDVIPANMKAEGLGLDIYRLMALSKIPGAELNHIARQLS